VFRLNDFLNVTRGRLLRFYSFLNMVTCELETFSRINSDRTNSNIFADIDMILERH
jgi:hypothetical protein